MGRGTADKNVLYSPSLPRRTPVTVVCLTQDQLPSWLFELRFTVCESFEDPLNADQEKISELLELIPLKAQEQLLELPRVLAIKRFKRAVDSQYWVWPEDLREVTRRAIEESIEVLEGASLGDNPSAPDKMWAITCIEEALKGTQAAESKDFNEREGIKALATGNLLKSAQREIGSAGIAVRNPVEGLEEVSVILNDLREVGAATEEGIRSLYLEEAAEFVQQLENLRLG